MNQNENDADNEFDDLEKEFERLTDEFLNRKKYSELNCDIIKTITDDKLEQAIVDFIGLKIKEDWENDVVKVPMLGAGFSAIYFLSNLETEVNNGGFNQMFYNSGKEAVVMAKMGAELLGMSELAAIIATALQIAENESGKMDVVKKVGTLEAFMESYDDISFDAADNAFFELKIDFSKPKAAFIREHCHLFEGRVS